MKKLTFVISAVALIAVGCTSPTANTQSSTNTAPTSNKFVDQTYYKQSYLISSDTLTPDAQLALTGFTLDKKANADGTTLITLKAQKEEYHDQQYTLKPGEQLYFIEKFLKDDENNEEKNLRDDTAVVVDSDGNVVQQPTDWSK